MNTKDFDNDKWFEALTGRLTEKENPAKSELEGKILRDAILSEHRKTLDTVENTKQESLERLRFKMKREGLLKKNSKTESKRSSMRLWGIPLPAAAAAAISAAILLPLTFHSSQTPLDTNPGESLAQSPRIFESQTPKASLGNLSLIYSPTPQQTAIKLSEALQALGIPSQAYQLNGNWRLKAQTDLSTPSHTELLALAQEYGFDVSEDGLINILIKSK